MTSHQLARMIAATAPTWPERDPPLEPVREIDERLWAIHAKAEWTPEDWDYVLMREREG